MKKKVSGSRKSSSAGKNPSRLIIDSVRKPVPPPTAPHGEAKPAERAHPANRKTKHKKPDTEDDGRGQVPSNVAARSND